MHLPHHHTTGLTVLLFAGNRTLREQHEEFEYELHDVVNVYFQGWPDERKADLYARLAESVRGDMGFAEASAAVSRCLRANFKEFYHG